MNIPGHLRRTVSIGDAPCEIKYIYSFDNGVTWVTNAEFCDILSIYKRIAITDEQRSKQRR